MREPNLKLDIIKINLALNEGDRLKNRSPLFKFILVDSEVGCKYSGYKIFPIFNSNQFLKSSVHIAISGWYLLESKVSVSFVPSASP